MPSRFYLEVSDDVAAKLDALPASNSARRSRVLEDAINAVLDDAGWPRLPERGRDDIPRSHWFVVVSRGGKVHGHVGPLADEAAARRVVSSWASGGHRAMVSRRPMGPCLTNAAGGAWP
jgi:hypothetical protein